MTAVAADTSVNSVQQMVEEAVQPPVDSDIISTAQLWAEQINEAIAAKHSEEAQMVNAEDSSNSANSKAQILEKNRLQGRLCEQRHFAKFSQQYSHAEEQVTIKTDAGVRTRVDAIGIDSNENVVIHEVKSSLTAPLTKNQKIAFEEIEKNGGVVVGKGKGIFRRGYKIPAGTKIEIIRPE